MKLKAMKKFFVFLALFLVLYPTNCVLAMQIPSGNNLNIPKAYSIKIYEESEYKLTMTSPNTGIFHFAILDKNGADITNIVPSSSVSIKTFIGPNDSIGSFDRRRTKVDLDFQTGTATVSLESSDSDKILSIDFSYNNNPSMINFSPDDILRMMCHLSVNAPDKSNEYAEIELLSDYLTDMGNSTAVFHYKVLDYGRDITKTFPISLIDAYTSISSSISFDPLTGTGTIKFDAPVTDQIIKTTISHKLTGATIVLYTSGLGKNPVKRQEPVELSKMNFVTGSLLRTGKDTATFNYKVLDHYNSNITKIIPAEEIRTSAFIGTSEAKVSLNPATGEGTIKYSFSDDDKKAMVTLIHKSGIEASAMLNVISSEPTVDKAGDDNDLQIAQIVFLPTGGNSFYSNRGGGAYRIYNQYGKNITRQISATRLTVSSSVNAKVYVDPASGGCGMTYNGYDVDRTIIVSITDKATGVKASMNIGAAPTEDSAIDTTTDSSKIIYFKDPVLEKAVRELLHKPTADITENDVKNITNISIGPGCEDLAGIENLKGLNYLDIRSNKIRSLAPLKQLPTLGRLIYITDTINDIKTLAELTNLSLLDIKGVKISDEDFALLKNNLTKCYILR